MTILLHYNKGSEVLIDSENIAYAYISRPKTTRIGFKLFADKYGNPFVEVSETPAEIQDIIRQTAREMLL